jgi:uncharacterized membrane protein
VLAFSDGLFAIAMTLLIVAIGVPDIPDGDDIGDLADALDDLKPELISFFISFAVIGRYWLAHHQFFSQLGAVNSPLLTANLVYLAAIAFVPYPTGLVSRFDDSPVTVVIYALALATASFMEAVMFGMARRGGLLRIAFRNDVFRYELVASLLPVLVFAISVPIAFVDTRLALCSWLAVFPAEWLIARAAPTGFEPLE